MPKLSNRIGMDTLDTRFNPTETLLNQLELNKPFIEHMLADRESKAEIETEKEGNDD